MPAPIVIRDLMGLGQGISQAGSALGEALKKRSENKQKQQQQNILNSVLSKADFSTPEGKKEAIGELMKGGMPIKDVMSVMDVFNDPVTALTEKYAAQDRASQDTTQIPPPPGAIEETEAEISLPAGAPSGVQSQQMDPNVDLEEVSVDAFSQLPEEALVEAASSGNKRLMAMAEAENGRRGRAEKRYQSDRKYHAEGSRPWLKKIDDMRQSTRNKSMAMEMMANAVEEGNLEFFSPDNFANFLGKFGEGLRSPEGVLLLNATKEFLLSNIQRAGQRPNQWIEQQIIQMLPKIGRSQEANQSVIEALRAEVTVQKAYQDETDRLANYYRKKMGVVPENIGAIVEQSVEPLAKQAQDKLAYRLREIKEAHGDIKELSSKKVFKGTPLTMGMATHLAKEYGPDKAFERAKKLGYSIPSKEEYLRYSK